MKKVIKITLLVLNFIALALLLASTMGGWVAPSKFMFFSMMGYGYLYFLVANLIFVIVWLCFGSKWFLLSLIGIVLRCTYLPLYFQIGGTESLTAEELAKIETLKVMTFNTHAFRGVDNSKELIDSNMNQFLSLVDEEQPDVMTLQEYAGRNGKLLLTDSLMERGYIYQASGHRTGSITGNVIFSKLPIVATDRIKNSSIVYADLLRGKDTLRLICVHLNSYGLDDSDHKQIHDISHGNVDSTTGRSTYRKFRETILSHEEEFGLLEPYFTEHRHYIIVAGDYNDPPSSYFYQKCRKYLKDSYCEAGQGFSTTYHGSFTKNVNATFPAFRIDMVLHSPDLKACAYKRVKSEMSDHYPVIVTLEINKEAKE